MTPLILAVDDEHDVTDLARVRCGNAGYAVVTATSGREAIATINDRGPDLILLDLMLPDIDGFSVCEILRSDAATPDSRSVGPELGALDYITTPFSPKDLVDRVTRPLRLRPPSA